MFEGKKLICPLSGKTKFENLFTIKKFPIYMGVVNKNHKSEFKDLNFKINRTTGTVQIFPRIPLKKLYFKSHQSGKVGNVWKTHHYNFFKLLKKYFKGNVVEIGGGHNPLSKNQAYLKMKSPKTYFTIDPNGKHSKHKNHKLIKNFFDESIIKKIGDNKDLIFHSHLFEHLYDPNIFLRSIYNLLKNRAFHVFSIPNIKEMIKKGYANGMNFEHPYYLEENLVDILLKNNGFKIIKKFFFINHSIIYVTQKVNTKKKFIYSKYTVNKKLFNNFITNKRNDIKRINKKIAKLNNQKVFLFGAHIFSQLLIFNGLNMKNITGVIDNDKSKQKNYLYGTNLEVNSTQILKNLNKPIIILRAAQYDREIKENILKNINKNAVFV